jgi:AraC family transcriptional regulator, regulatory protein of adaptative response / methylated-DNA-[protein]-cysteine methyltransferase
MTEQAKTNYIRIAEAIGYIKDNFKSQPGLNEVAEKVALSPYHFQRMFTDWAGVSPKKFLQYLTVEHAKRMLKDDQASLFDTAIETGLSGTGRLHDLFINIEGMTPGEYKNGGESLSINYSFAESPFGNMLVASTSKGICHMSFADDEREALKELKAKFPNASYRQMVDLMQQNVLYFFTYDWSKLNEVKLHLKGTEFQLKVWETLLKVPMGRLTTYGSIAKKIDLPKASRAVGTAVGDNPVAFLIPCHRIIQSTGIFGDYHWGRVRKTAMIGWEAARAESMGNCTPL